MAMTEQDAARLQEIRERADKATPGPWQQSGVRAKFPVAGQAHAVGPDGDAVALVFYDPKHHAQHYADSQFIAHAREDITLLLRLLDAARPHDAEFVAKATHDKSMRRITELEKLVEGCHADWEQIVAERDVVQAKVIEGLRQRIGEYVNKIVETEKERDRLAAELVAAHGLQARADAAEARIVELQRTLLYYADEKLWIMHNGYWEASPTLDRDHGDKARAALATASA